MNTLQFTSHSSIGWSAPGPIIPSIYNLSSYYCPAGVRTMVVISGGNFRPYSVVKFGTLNPTTYFVSSQQIEFYIPSTVVAGIYNIQVFNDGLGSQTVEYTLDYASGHWFEHNGGIITNTNGGGVILNGETICNGSLNVAGAISGPVIDMLVQEIKDIRKELKEVSDELKLYKK